MRWPRRSTKSSIVREPSSSSSLSPAPALSLRPLTENDSDAAVMLAWLTEQRVLEWVYGRDQVYTLERVRAEWAPATLAAEHVWPQLIMLGDRPIGYLQLVWAQPHNVGYQADGDLTNAYAFDMFIGDPDLWGVGLGTEVCAHAISVLRAEHGAQRVLIDPRVVNERAVHVYEKVGFRRVKPLPGNELHEGVHFDCWLMELDWHAFHVYQNT